MNPTRKRRLAFVVVLILVAAAAGTLITLALQENLTYLHTPAEVKSGQVPAARFRLGGIVCEGSIRRREGTLLVDFAITDRVRQVTVEHDGILPDMFKEGTSVIATGQMRGDTFVASDVLAKHDESYMPKEVKDAMDKGRALHTKSCGAN
jgi:cytochrome c-type biogenesis protein CcmE